MGTRLTPILTNKTERLFCNRCLKQQEKSLSQQSFHVFFLINSSWKKFYLKNYIETKISTNDLRISILFILV